MNKNRCVLIIVPTKDIVMRENSQIEIGKETIMRYSPVI